jgi:alcohol dehydrogenase (cytochrome c)
VNELNWTKGLDPKTGMPVEYDPKLDVQKYCRRRHACRRDGMKRTCPTWHGGVATSRRPTIRSSTSPMASARRLLHPEWSTAAFKSPEGGLDREKFSKRTYTSDLYYGSITAYDTVSHKVVAKASPTSRTAQARWSRRRGRVHRAAGRLDRRLHDETLEELWRFNVGTPLKGAPVTYSIGPKQYLAVQSAAATCIQSSTTGSSTRAICSCSR